MKPGLVDDYLSALLGSGVAAPAAPPAPPASTPPQAPPAPAASADVGSDEISEAEFEALLDSLHGGKAPGAAESAIAASDEISEAEFEALLDSLHGGKAPGAADVATAAVSATPAELAAPPKDEAGQPHWRGEERRQASGIAARWLRLRVHQQDYAVELLKVREVLLPVPVLAMRDTDPAIRGVMNLRGVVVPVLDLGLWLDLEEVQDSPQTRFVVLEHDGECLALRVSAVLDVHAVSDTRIEPAEHTLTDPGSAMLRGVTRLNAQPVILLDAVGLLG